MPEISRFLGIVIAIDYRDHAPPHFPARYGDYESRIAIEDGIALSGDLPVAATSEGSKPSRSTVTKTGHSASTISTSRW